MQKLLILALCVAAAAASVNPFAASGAAVIEPKGVVSPVTRCGGVATFVELRISECDGFCYMTPGHKYDIEADIIPATSSPSLTLEVKVRVFGTDITILTTVLPNSSVQPGQQYTILFSITPNDLLSGQIVVITSNVNHSNTGLLEICIQHNISIV